MKKYTKSLVTAVAVGTFSLAGIGIASAATQYVGGGTWDYGTNVQYSYSNYFHNGLTHSSTAKNGNGGTVTSGRKAPGAPAYAQVNRTISGNQAFWNTY